MSSVRCRSSGEASAGPPEAEPGQQYCGGDEDAGFGELQGPEVAAGLVGEVLAQAEAADPVQTGIRSLVLAAVLRVGGAGEEVAGGGDGVVGQYPGAVGVNAADDLDRPARGDRQALDAAEIHWCRGMRHRDEVGADPQRHRYNGADVDGERSGHGGDSAADQHAGGDAEGEGEQGVADRGDAAGAVDERGDPVVVGVVDVVRPGGDGPAEQPDARRRGGADDGEFGGQPAGAGDRLVEGEAVGAGFEFPGEQGRPPEDPDQGGDHMHQGEGVVVDLVVDAAADLVEEGADRGAAVAVAGGGAAGGPEIGKVVAGHCEGDGDDGQAADGDPGLGAELAPGEPDHRVVSNTGVRLDPLAAWAM